MDPARDWESCSLFSAWRVNSSSDGPCLENRWFRKEYESYRSSPNCALQSSYLPVSTYIPMKSSTLKDKILELKSQGLSHRQVSEILDCTKSSVSYNWNTEVREKDKKRRDEYVKNNSLKIKLRKKLDSMDRAERKKLCSKSLDFQKRGVKYNRLPFTFEDLFEKLLESPYCHLTGKKLNVSKPSTYTLDHIMPVTRGGTKHLDNVGPATLDANRAKNNMTVDEFIAFCKSVLVNFGYKVSKKVRKAKK
jgi:hypothetical protein